MQEALRRLEQIVHPLVADERQRWLKEHQEHFVLLLDIPLLFETDGASMVGHTADICRLAKAGPAVFRRDAHAGGRNCSCERSSRDPAITGACAAGHDTRYIHARHSLLMSLLKGA